MANPDQVNILEGANPASIWNHHRRIHPDQEIDLSGADLQYITLSGCNLSRANLRGANLSDCNLSNTDFSNADLRWCMLTNANLTNSNCRNADFRYSRLQGTVFAQSYNHDHERINLENAHFSACNLSRTSGLDSNINLRNTKFDRSQFNFIILRNRNFILCNVSFIDSSLEHSLSNYIFDDVNFKNCLFGTQNSNSVDYRHIVFTHVKFTNCIFQRLSFENSFFIQCRFEGCRFQDVNFSDATLHNIKVGRDVEFQNCLFDTERMREISSLRGCPPIFSSCSSNIDPHDITIYFGVNDSD